MVSKAESVKGNANPPANVANDTLHFKLLYFVFFKYFYKPRKDPAKLENYRLIALPSHVGLTMERMIKQRLALYLKAQGHIQIHQSV